MHLEEEESDYFLSVSYNHFGTSCSRNNAGVATGGLSPGSLAPPVVGLLLGGFHFIHMIFFTRPQMCCPGFKLVLNFFFLSTHALLSIDTHVIQALHLKQGYRLEHVVLLDFFC